MLFSYKYINHDLTRFHEYIDHLVRQVWCKASGEFSIDLLHPQLREIVEDLGHDESVKTDHLYHPIKVIHDLFRTLSESEKSQIRAWHDANNDVEGLCAGDTTKQPGTYAMIADINTALADKLKTFFTNLYTKVLNLSAITTRFGSLRDHYNQFASTNKPRTCGFCGCSQFVGRGERHREPYDHYLPKSIYPFNSVNCRNLAPMCALCNSTYKMAKSPIEWTPADSTVSQRRKAFYPYAQNHTGIGVSVSIDSDDLRNLSKTDVSVQLCSVSQSAEVATWTALFGIAERYRDLCSDDGGVHYWLVQTLDECLYVPLTVDQFLTQVAVASNAAPWTDLNFLKAPFVSACKARGLV
jgi:hypothetical protein